MSVQFEFGNNWKRFLTKLDNEKIQRAQRSLLDMLGFDTLKGMSFLDAGCGSGLFSLAARMSGARVHSFDYDPQCAGCALELKSKYFPDDKDWSIEQASVLDASYLDNLGKFDIVYSWGVLHHTGNMWKASANISSLVSPGGFLFISIYNDQGFLSRLWRRIKEAYNKTPRVLRPMILLPCAFRLWGPTILKDLARFRPFYTWRIYSKERGMSPWCDVVDWVGGYPFEVAKPEEVFDFFHARSFELQKLKTCAGGHGCNEYLFRMRNNL